MVSDNGSKKLGTRKDFVKARIRFVHQFQIDSILSPSGHNSSVLPYFDSSTDLPSSFYWSSSLKVKERVREREREKEECGNGSKENGNKLTAETSQEYLPVALEVRFLSDTLPSLEFSSWMMIKEGVKSGRKVLVKFVEYVVKCLSLLFRRVNIQS